MNKLLKSLVLSVFCIHAVHSQPIMHGDVIINEILFNPSKDGFDYVEGYNRSKSIIHLNELMIANRNGANEIVSIKNISKDLLLLEPGEFFIITVNEKWVKQHYPLESSAIVLQVSSLPSFPDDEGSVLFLRKSDSLIIDELNYNEKWHFKMIDEPEGVALERISYDLPTQEKNNWTSASSSSGYGTPGMVNSQYRQEEKGTSVISVLPKIFSPDNDGHDDFASINITVKEQGKIANAVIYDVTGRRVRYIMKNELLGASNRFLWDGYDDRAQKLGTGIYIIVTQVFDLEGNVSKYKNVVILNRIKR